MAKKEKRGRPRLAVKRSKRFVVCLTPEEFAMVKAYGGAHFIRRRVFGRH